MTIDDLARMEAEAQRGTLPAGEVVFLVAEVRRLREALLSLAELTQSPTAASFAAEALAR